MDDFREAWCVELYDPLVIIQRVDADASGTTVYGELPGYTLPGDDLAKLLEHIPSIETTTVPYQDKAGKTWGRPISSTDIPFKRQMIQFGAEGNLLVEDIEAKIESGGNLLHIRVHVRGTDLTKWVEDLTYSGRYLVHWSPLEERPAAT